MQISKSILTKGILAAMLAGGAMMAATGTASAEIACNRAGECWHVGQRYTTYPATLGVVIHEDSWRAHHWNSHYQWREHNDDHGYYDHGVWRAF